MSGAQRGPAPGVVYAVVLWNELTDMGVDPKTAPEYIRSLQAKVESLERLREADRAFYVLTVAQRDRAWRENEALKADLAEAGSRR